MNASAGWYPTGDGTSRYWDRNQWIEAPPVRPTRSWPACLGRWLNRCLDVSDRAPTGDRAVALGNQMLTEVHQHATRAAWGSRGHRQG